MASKIHLITTTDKLEIIRSSAANIDTHVSFTDVASGAGTIKYENHQFSSAATADLCAAPSGTDRRAIGFVNIRNRHATLPCDVTVQYNSTGAVVTELVKQTLNPGDTLYFTEGTGWFVIASTAPPTINESTSAQSPFSSDTYLAGSSLLLPGPPSIGTAYKLKFDVTKTNAGTATPIVTVRFGTAGSTADTARMTFTFGAGTAVVDTGQIEVLALFRTVGSGTSAVLQGSCELRHQLASTGLTNTGTAGYANVLVTSAGFDSTVASSIIGTSYNGGASAAHTIQLVRAEVIA